jgi:uncharacterized membrane protein YeiH
VSWEIFNIIGTIAFALSGAIVAIDEDYDLFGIYTLGFVTAFAGGAIRNLLIGVPVSTLWNQGELFWAALAAMTLLYYYPSTLISHWYRWGSVMDAIGLSAFAIQGAMYAKSMNMPLSAVIVAALLTGVGGGIVRDVLAQRQPLVFKYELYAFWAILVGITIGVGIVKEGWTIYTLFLLIIVLRLLSLKFGWRMPKVIRKKRPGES